VVVSFDFCGHCLHTKLQRMMNDERWIRFLSSQAGVYRHGFRVFPCGSNPLPYWILNLITNEMKTTLWFEKTSAERGMARNEAQTRFFSLYIFYPAARHMWCHEKPCIAKMSGLAVWFFNSTYFLALMN
jgi:hypothetical protein